MTTFTKTEKLIRALASGEPITVAQLERRTGLQNLSATVSRLRDQRYQIELVTHKNARNKIVNSYRMVS